MSPGRFGDDQISREEINGPRPSPLKIYKDSHLIQKSSSSLSFNGITTSAYTKHHQQQHNRQRHHPVIIYTHSPKIIHTKARDFMALVQKLTGFSRSDDYPVQLPQSLPEGSHWPSSEGNNNNITRPSSAAAAAAAAVHEDESSSVVTDENCGGGDIQVSSSSVSPVVFEPPANPFFSDIPLFTPNSANFFCSPRPLYRYPDSILTPSDMGSMSPKFLEVMKEFQGY